MAPQDRKAPRSAVHSFPWAIRYAMLDAPGHSHSRPGLSDRDWVSSSSLHEACKKAAQAARGWAATVSIANIRQQKHTQ